MNKTAIKNFAISAREKLITDITYKAGLIGVSADGIKQPLPQSTKDMQFFDIGLKEYSPLEGKAAIEQRNALVKAINDKAAGSDYTTAFNAIIEEIAYTWFNRLIAIRFMEVNDYLPGRVRVLSSELDNKTEPDLVTNPFDSNLQFTDAEKEQIFQMKDQNKLEDLFRMLFIKQCNKLHEILPELFETTNDYTELLLNIAFADKDGVVYKLVHDIPEDDFNVEKEGQVEIIGWMYQYYISEKHNQIVNIYKGTVKKDDIPAATQLFTTDWVVRYMVDNSLGRYWIERNPESKLADKLEYFVTPKDGVITYVNEKISPQDLTFFDPCMGSGHILVYAFDVLIEIYRECGYSDRDAALNIVQYNLYGLDIDKRAYQLAYFAVMMKARSYNRRALTAGMTINLAVIEESNDLDKFQCEGICFDSETQNTGNYLLTVFKDAKEIGSLQIVESKDYKSFAESMLNLHSQTKELNIFSDNWIKRMAPAMLHLSKQAAILSNKYSVVCTNPPYLNKFEGVLKKYLIDNFKTYSGDLFSAFMFRNFDFCKQNGYSAFMTPFVWMFIKTYEPLREYIIKNHSITTLIQMEYSAFEEATVPICTFVLKKGKDNNASLCFRLSDFKGGMEVQKQKVIEALADKNCGYFYEADENNFSKIPGSPIAYWVSINILNLFDTTETIGQIGQPKQGSTLGDNSTFLRFWFEVADNKPMKWFKCMKGGEYRRWYGNQYHVLNWENNGASVKNTGRATIRSSELLFHEGITWSNITSGKSSFRYMPENFFFESTGSVCFINREYLGYLLGFLNCPITESINKAINPTLHLQSGDIAKLPLKIDIKSLPAINRAVENSILLSKYDWDSFETSWDFIRHSLAPSAREHYDQIHSQFCNSRMEKFGRLSWHYENWERECEDRFNQLKANEEELNRIFIDIYGLQDELTPEVEDKDVTVRKADLQRDIKSLLSYAVGCMFGRYSLDVDGLAYAGGEWDDSKYSTFIPDKDNCIPITDEEYFEDDIVGLFCAWLKKVYGEDTLEENLDFIANALGNKGKTSREVIRNYFLNDFIKDHIKIYQKRPIYWLFDSGKQNGFKALVYMHRWNADTVGNLRVEYLHRMQKVYDREIDRMKEIADTSKDNKEISAANKRKEKLQKQLQETQKYDEKIGHIALSRIDIDLDDGVKVNYEKVQTGKDGKKVDILAKI